MKRPQRKGTQKLESQDDIAYLTGRRSDEEREKQVKSPSPRRGRTALPQEQPADV